jgi:uncharacterized membrane protein
VLIASEPWYDCTVSIPRLMHGRDDGNDHGTEILFGISFPGLLLAQEFLLAMNRISAAGHLGLKGAVLVVKDDDGKVHVRETVDPQPGRSAVSGAMLAGFVGLLVGGPVGWLAGLGLGAGAGAITAKVVDLGIPDAWVDWFKDAVREGTATVVVLANQVDMRVLEAEVHRFAGAELVHTTLPVDGLARLQAALKADPPG